MQDVPVTDAETYKLDELAEQAGVSPRTVRYYVQRGLLPGPTFRGKDSSYGREHLVRLKAIKRLQEQFLPLDAVQEALAQRTLEQIERLSDGRDVLAPTQIAPPPSRVEPPAAPRWQRHTLAPGVELNVAEGVDEDTRKLVEWLLNQAAAHRPDGRGGSRQ
jgi:DNA-binding transcriptional MerR regulator